MELKLKDILAISGQPGLYKFLAQGNGGIIVESLTDGKRTNVSAASKVSSMAEIAIYTETDDMPLSEVFGAMFKHTEGKQAISHKSSPDQLKAAFADALPQYDKERVHISDIKKVFSWFNALVEAGMKDFSVEQGE